MGQLKPGMQYTYEYEHGIVYAKEPDGERFVIGWNYVPIDTTSKTVETDE
jgi:hypothetical protein